MRSSILYKNPVLWLICILLLSACDLTDDEVAPSDVAGEYDFTDFRFVPKSQFLPPVVVLDTLVQSQTRLQLFSSGRFTLLYQFEDGDTEFIGGDFTVNEERVRLSGHEDEERFYNQLLLPAEFTLRRQESGTLSATISRTVNLEEFSPKYEGLRTVDGVIELTLTRR